jgi:DNA-binding NarL/FixJ family response regulator
MRPKSFDHPSRVVARVAALIETNRDPALRSQPKEAVAIGRALADGRWSLVDHFDHEGRRYLIARPSEPDARAWAKLTERERVAVAFASMGHANELIAYELGLAPLIAAYKRDVT